MSECITQRHWIRALVVILTGAGVLVWWASSATGTQPFPAFAPSAPDARSVTPVAQRLAHAPERQADNPVHGYYTAAIGTVLIMAIHASQESEVRMAQAPEPARFEMTSEGRMRLTVVGRRPGQVIVGVSFPRIDLRVRTAGVLSDPEESVEVERFMGKEATLLMTDKGEVLGWRFGADVPSHVRTLVRGLVGLVRFVGGDEGQVKWSTTESDPSGEYRVAYQRLPDANGEWRVARNRLGLKSNESSSAVGAATVSDTAVAQFDPALGWLVAATCKERVDMGGETTDLQVRASSSVTLRLEEMRTEAVTVAPAWDAAWESASSAVDCRADEVARQRNEDEALVAGASAEELLLDLRRCTQGGVETAELLDARSRVMALLRQRPGTYQTIQRMMLDGSLNEEAIGVALSAVGAVATHEAQELLAALVVDKTIEATIREYSLLALFQVAEPNATTRSAVKRLWDDILDDAQLRSTALLLLGAQAKSSDVRFQELLALAPAGSDPMLPTFLEAVGNAGHLEVVETYLTHAEVSVRKVAERILARQKA